MQIFEYRKGRFAIGAKGKKAAACAYWDARRKRYVGQRGVRPIIARDLTPVKNPGASLRETLKSLVD